MQELYLGSLQAIGIDPEPARHPLRRGRLGEPDPRRLGPRLGGLVRRHGGHPVHLLPAGGRARVRSGRRRADLRARAAGDVRPGRRERLRPRLQRAAGDSRYGDVFLENEREFSAYNFEDADTGRLFRALRGHGGGVPGCSLGRTGQPLVLPAYDQCSRPAIAFNLLDARGAIASPSARATSAASARWPSGCGEGWVEDRGHGPA